MSYRTSSLTNTAPQYLVDGKLMGRDLPESGAPGCPDINATEALL